VFKGLTSSAQT